MTNGEYVYISYGAFLIPSPVYGNITWQHFDELDQYAFDAYRSLFLLVPAPSQDAAADQIQANLAGEIKRRSLANYNYTYGLREELTAVVWSAYSSLHVLGQVIYDFVVHNPGRAQNGSAFLAEKFWNADFSTPVGTLLFDKAGETKLRSEIRQLNQSTGVFEAVITTNKDSSQLEVVKPIVWWTGEGMPPDRPVCGFGGNTGPCAEALKNRNRMILYVSVGVVIGLVVVTVLGGATVRYILGEASLGTLKWQLRDLEYTGSDLDLSTNGLLDPKHVPAVWRDFPSTLTVLPHTGAHRRIERRFLRLAVDILSLVHRNVVTFYGVSILPHHVVFVFESCQRGELHQFLHHPPITLDRNIKQGLIGDLVQGTKAIHRLRFVKYHGLLNCSTCVIDKHFTLKITDLAIQRLYQTGFHSNKVHEPLELLPEKIRFHLAPEILAEAGDLRCARQRSDIYSVGTLYAEIISEGVAHKQPDNIFEGFVSSFEGILPNHNALPLIRACGHVDPSKRPTLTELSAALLGKRHRGTVAEKILARLSSYAHDLEVAVGARTQELLWERQKCDQILLHMLPASIVGKLRRSEQIHPESFDEATLQFSDIVGFPKFVHTSTPFEVVDFLSQAHGLFDQTVGEFDVYKVETIGDSYFIASGLPRRNGDEHAETICRTAIRLQRDFARFRLGGDVMHLRIGCHSGPVIASVVGLQRPRYCLFGDTVNTASRMESHGEACAIHLSSDTAALIRNVPNLSCAPRGAVEVKGKGAIHTYWLIWKDDLDA